MKRVHEKVEAASKIVFMDSSGTMDHDGSRVFVLLTHADCGGLPLGVIITSSESAEIIKTGLQCFKTMMGEKIFFKSTSGPTVFVTDDSLSEHMAINETWPHSKIFLCIFHVLQSVWRWLVKTKNSVPESKQKVYYEHFRDIMYAKTEDDCKSKYELAVAEAADSDSYLRYLNSYWQRKHMWALAYRNTYDTQGHNTNNFSEAVMRILKDKIFCRVKAFNLSQMVDFILTKFVQYYKIRLLDAASNRLRTNIFGKTIKVPSSSIIENIKIVSEHVAMVPSETTEKLFYIVNLNALMCSCFEGNTGKICKHIDWVSAVVFSKRYETRIDNKHLRKLFYFIATGKEALTEEWFEPLFNQSKDDYIPSIQPSTSSGSVVSSEDTFANTNFKEESKNESQARVNNSLQRFAEITQNFFQKNPKETADALEKFTENAERISTMAAYLSSCANFAKGNI